MDGFPGILSDPASLHKYIYSGNDPVNKIDPNGEFGIVESMATINIIGNLLNIKPLKFLAPIEFGKWKVDVRAKDVPYSDGRFQHLWIVYTDFTGIEYYFRGGPSGGYPSRSGFRWIFGYITTNSGFYVHGVCRRGNFYNLNVIIYNDDDTSMHMSWIMRKKHSIERRLRG